MLGHFFESAFGFLVETILGIFSIPIVWVGELTRLIISCGKHRFRWDCYLSEGGGKFVFYYEVSFWVGLIVVGSIGVLVKYLLPIPDFLSSR